ncbi:hypothetical protein BU23DRAFT_556681, partial [Bimuria novae-zelandiae CBS 107.79]
MHFLSIVLFSTLACVSQGRSLSHPQPERRRQCESGDAGGVYIEIKIPFEPNTPYAHDTIASTNRLPSSKATQCLTKQDLGVASDQVVSMIGPEAGGNCLVYSSLDCAPGTGMDLWAPPGVQLKYN